MTNIKEYLQRKEKRETDSMAGFKQRILQHKIRVFTRMLAIFLVAALVGVVLYIQIENRIYSGYATVFSLVKEQFPNNSHVSYGNGFITYSKDGISYTDYKGNALWNHTYEMQSPIVRVEGNCVVVGDYNGHMIYRIDTEGKRTEIDTHLPIRDIAASESGVIAAVLEDTNVTWINVYNPSGEKAVSMRTTMQKSGYPIAVSLSAGGTLLGVSYMHVDAGSMKSSVAYYNFGEVGKNHIDNYVSGYDYADTVVPYLTFVGGDTVFAVGDNRLMIYSDKQIPTSSFEKFLDGEVLGVYHNESYIGIVFRELTAGNKYRLDLYDKSGALVSSQGIGMEYSDIVLYKDTIIVYNEAEFRVSSAKGQEKYAGSFQKQVLLLKPLNNKKYLLVTPDMIDIIEMN